MREPRRTNPGNPSRERPGSPRARDRRGARGFSLIELLIVVAIILVIAAIAIPSLIRSKIAANQASAVQSLRILNSVEVVYSATYPQGYSANIISLGPPAPGTLSSATSADLIDSLLASGSKSGYTFVYAATPDPNGHYTTYTINANPTSVGSTGTNFYFTDATGLIRQNSSATAGPADSPVGG